MGSVVRVALLLALASASPAFSQMPPKQVITGVDAPSMLRLMRNNLVGFDSVELVDSTELKVTSDGAETIVRLLRCNTDSTDCGGLAFNTAFGKQDGVDLKWVNRFNEEASMGRMYLHDFGLALYFYVDIYPGVTEDFVIKLGSAWNEEVRSALTFKPTP